MSFNEQLTELYLEYKESSLYHRYITQQDVAPSIYKLASKFDVSTIGFSVNKIPIYKIVVGQGSKKILMWSQMHGNESTTTKAIFDMLNTLFNDQLGFILEHCELCIIPILNPDGAKAYTRLNANNIDLNRDAQDLSQPESKVLRKVFNDFKPDFCFNLHGQRTIFSAGKTKNPATISFLAPAQDRACTVTTTRKRAMSVIVEMYKSLLTNIPNQIGVYDDAFNLNCVGDTFQSLNVPTILFEVGHYKDDYAREDVRQLIYQSLCVAIEFIANNSVSGNNYKAYFNIPENKKLFYDIIIRNVVNKENEHCAIGIQYQEKLIGKVVKFFPKVETISNLKGFHAHKEINANCYPVLDKDGQQIEQGYENDFVYINSKKIALNINNS